MKIRPWLKPIYWAGKYLSKFIVKNAPRILLFTPPRNAHEALFVFRRLVEQESGSDSLLVMNSDTARTDSLIHSAGTKAGLIKIPDATAKKFSFAFVFYLGVFYKVMEQHKPVAIGGNHPLFYALAATCGSRHLLLEWIDSIQSFHSSVAVLPHLDARIFATQRLLEDATGYYQEQQVAEELYDRLAFIEIGLPPAKLPATSNEILKVIAIDHGHGSDRIALIRQLRQRQYQQRFPFEITIISASDFQNFVRERSGRAPSDLAAQVEKDIEKADTLLYIPAVAEDSLELKLCLSMGMAIIATNVDFIPEYIIDGVNGYLIPYTAEDQKTFDDCSIALSILASDRHTLAKIQRQNHTEAANRFSEENFYQQWQQLINI